MSDALKHYAFLCCELDSVYHELSRILGVSDSIMTILYTLYDYGDGCRQNEIYRLSGLTRQTVNSSVKKMEREKLVFLKNGEGRNVCVFLTESGRTLMNRVISPIKEAEESVINSWTAEERTEYIRLTQKFVEGMKSQRDKIRLSAGCINPLPDIP